MLYTVIRKCCQLSGSVRRGLEWRRNAIGVDFGFSRRLMVENWKYSFVISHRNAGTSRREEDLDEDKYSQVGGIDDEEREEKRGDLTEADLGIDTGERRSMGVRKSVARKKMKLKEEQRKYNKKEILIPLNCTAKTLSSVMRVRTVDLIKDMIRLGSPPETADDPIPVDLADLLAELHHYIPMKTVSTIKKQSKNTKTLLNPTETVRPPVVTIMGHVDHGKTTLLDYLRKTNVAAQEAGGITQSIGAFLVECKDPATNESKNVTFLDTPGHEAFSSMRERGARITDIVVLVVSANAGVMPQTLEAIKLAQQNNVSMIIAISKIDREDADIAGTRNELRKIGLQLQDDGGDIPVVEISARSGKGIKNLEEAILMQSEVLELKSHVQSPPKAYILESQKQTLKGKVATLIIRDGELKLNQWFVCGKTWGCVKAIRDAYGKHMTKAGPSMAVEISGFKAGLPDAGEEFIPVEDGQVAKEIILYKERQESFNNPLVENSLDASDNLDFENNTNTELKKLKRIRGEAKMAQYMQQEQELEEAKAKEVRVIIKADVQGSIAPIEVAINALNIGEAKVHIIKSEVGDLTENDVQEAKNAKATLLLFNSKIPHAASIALRAENISCKTFKVIYHMVDHVCELMEETLPMVEVKETMGSALIKEIFEYQEGNKSLAIAGCQITDGSLSRKHRVRILRDATEVYDGPVNSIKRFKQEVKEVDSGHECGVTIGGFRDFQKGDKMESYIIKKVRASVPRPQSQIPEELMWKLKRA